MDIHDIRAKLAKDEPTIGTWLQLPSADVAELMARAGYDWVAVDMEHGSFGRTGLPDIFRAIQCGGAAPFARLPIASKTAIKAALELLARREWPENARQEYPEDETISKILLYLYGSAGVDVLEFRGGRRLIGVRTCDPRDLAEIARLARGGVCAVHCGQMAFYHPIVERDGVTIREACARVMWWILHASGPDSKTFEKAPEG